MDLRCAERPTPIDRVVTLQAAKAIVIPIPRWLRVRADRVMSRTCTDAAVSRRAAHSGARHLGNLDQERAMYYKPKEIGVDQIVPRRYRSAAGTRVHGCMLMSGVGFRFAAGLLLPAGARSAAGRFDDSDIVHVLRDGYGLLMDAMRDRPMPAARPEPLWLWRNSGSPCRWSPRAKTWASTCFRKRSGARLWLPTRLACGRCWHTRSATPRPASICDSVSKLRLRASNS